MLRAFLKNPYGNAHCIHNWPDECESENHIFPSTILPMQRAN